jgi:hypothetical protein
MLLILSRSITSESIKFEVGYKLSQEMCKSFEKNSETLMYMYLRKTSPYLSGSTLRLRYRDQPVNAVYCENHTEHTNALCGQNTEIFNVKSRNMYIVATVLEVVNYS